MAHFRSKPVEIEAVRFIGIGTPGLPQFDASTFDGRDLHKLPGWLRTILDIGNGAGGAWVDRAGRADEPID
jgi:hypothetical protein